MAGFQQVLIDYPIMTLFVVTGLGYLLGEINFFGFKFGVAGVLFAGLAVGSLSPDIALPEIVSSLGLILFVYAIGIQSGPAFFAGFRKQGCRDSLVGVAVLLLGALLALGLSFALRIPAARAAGLFCGATTNTPALAAARERARERARNSKAAPETIRAQADEPVLGYSIAYPAGVIGVLLCFQFLRAFWRASLEPAQETPEILVRDFVVRNPGVAGKTIADVLRLHRDPGFVVSRIRQAGRMELARPETVLEPESIVAVVGDAEALDRAAQIFGAASDTRIELDRSELDYRRVFVSSRDVVGRRIRDLDLPNRLDATITRIRRGDHDLVPSPDTRLEFGDRIRVLTRRDNFSAVSRFFGDSIRGTAETDYGSVSIGLVLGVLAGMIPIPLPGGQEVRLGLAGGPLLVALILGYAERTGRVTWTMPVSANLTLRHVGLLFFLAGAGTRAGYSFTTMRGVEGIQMLLGGALITFTVTLTTMVLGYKALGIPYDRLMGLTSGVQTQPACLAYAANLTPSDAPNVGYASVYPAAMISKIVLAQLLVTLGA